DTGVGIPLEHQARVFEPFLDVAGRDGLGLGLAITRRLVEAMGGHVGVESSPGSGTTFSFVLPFTLSPDAAADGADLAGAAVLVVDANDARREILGRWLTAWRARPTLVADGDAARAALERTRRAGTSFALLLVDVAVAGGIALLASSPGNRFVPAVLMSTPTGQDAYYPMVPVRVVRLRKPFSPDQLRASLAEALSRHDRDEPAAERRRRTARPLRVLVAEDSLTNLAIASALLERWGHIVTRADHGRAAVAAVHDAPYDLVLMDVRMPDIDGLEATRLIRARERTTAGRIPIVAMTASAMKGDRERCLEAGMDGYLAKPLDADELFEIVERFAAPAPGSC
ncbi:MAG TPA: response regulator, partial [Solirubrobacteraceae bacterium]